MGTSRAHAPLVVGLAAAAVVLGACTADDAARSVLNSDPLRSTTTTETSTSSSTSSSSSSSSTTGSAGGSTRSGTDTRPRGLQRFADCSAFLDYVKGEAQSRVGPYGLEGMHQYYGPDVVMMEASMDDMAPAATTAADSGGFSASVPIDTVDFTGTNVQEAGVDEPDIVKTDGTRIIAISNSTLSYIDVAGGTPVVTDQIDIDGGWGYELFFSGDRALLFTNSNSWVSPMPVDIEFEAEFDAEAPSTTSNIGGGNIGDGVSVPEHWVASARVTEVDLSDPSDLRVVSSMTIEGQYLSARAIGDRVRLAVSSGPQTLGWVYPSTPSGEDNATTANRSIIEETTLADWTPSFSVETGGDTIDGELLDCSQIHQPTEFSGFEMISIVDLDISAGLAASINPESPSSVGVLASGQTVYSSLDRMYVATTRWVPSLEQTEGWDQVRDDSYETSIHSFAIAAGEPTTYLASGAVPGSLLNQFSLDEHNGYLRAITTAGAPWSADGSESTLRVLAAEGDQLVEVGAVGGLGKGEQLYSARLMGDIGFAVTFRQIDPFYVLDLSDPFNPRITGELKIPGYSSYLHPVGDVAETGLVLGVGQDASDTGQVSGLKLSLFDVSDPANPVERDVWTLAGGSSGAEYDHRAFQMLGSTAILPTQSWTDGFGGATVFDVTADGIVERGRVEHAVPEFVTDCRLIDQPDLEEYSDLWWRASGGVMSVCTPDQTGNADFADGSFSGWCETITPNDLQYYVADGTQAAQQLEDLDLGQDDRIELCYPDTYSNAIQRSMVIADQLYTMSLSTLQANDLATLTVNASVQLN
ncbi:MAG TPA: beta-propeller domain-containing protein [Ilumatobacter sp.]|nr:beta-propeller domain-containing protein [Ilumatobacter sp.]